ncbi:MAG TPA: histidine phosphatase family protein [Stellaceae bacterium]|jgi:probable phosphoglycerate mutase|nr:histidine phosphatase family protein [Stellaceae bacterium]
MIFLVRHGETEWNLVRRYQGWGDSPLTARGVAQAGAIGRRLRALSEAAAAPVVASPLGRARRTAALIQAARGDATPVAFDERLKEISIGDWDGLDRDEIAERSPGIFERHAYGEWYFDCPGGETYDGFAGRIAAWLDETRGRTLIAVAHGIVTRVARGLYAGLPRAEALSLPVSQEAIWRLTDGRIEAIAV